MFLHCFKYTLKTLLKSKMLIFWTFAFPIILATFFNMAFANIENSEQLDLINLAIVDNNLENNQNYLEPIKTLSDKNNENRLFKTQYVSLKKAQQLLQQNKISGYLVFENDDIQLNINTNGINQSIIKNVIEEIRQTNQITNTLVTNKIKNTPNLDYQQIYHQVQTTIENSQNINLEDISNPNLSYMMIEFYSLIAMTCMYGAILTMASINQNLANMSNNGKRIMISPINKSKVIISSLLSSYLVQIVGVLLLFAYSIFVLKVDFGDNLQLTALLTTLGCLAGLSFGLMVATTLKVKENTKTGIIIALTMLGSFLAGMMGVTMKYVVDKNMPLINWINPVNMICDGLYALYYYDTLARYWFNIISIVIFVVIMVLIAFYSLRRQRYDSI